MWMVLLRPDLAASPAGAPAEEVRSCCIPKLWLDRIYQPAAAFVCGPCPKAAGLCRVRRSTTPALRHPIAREPERERPPVRIDRTAEATSLRTQAPRPLPTSPRSM